MSKNILMVLTSAAQFLDGTPTGLWLSEFTEPYHLLMAEGWQVTIASPKGGAIPIDPASQKDPLEPTVAALLQASLPLASGATDYDGLFIPGGHGTMFDLPENPILKELLREFYEAGKPLAALCHGPAALIDVPLSDGRLLVTGKRLTAFTDEEELASHTRDQVPFLLESKLKENGADFIAEANWRDHVEVDGFLVTGQNPQSARKSTLAFINLLA